MPAVRVRGVRGDRQAGEWRIGPRAGRRIGLWFG
ncbi:L-histidine N(alpha)-methyltransferase [Streptomyces sp. S816]|nr:L-histidine N(alpha)-methyltransferase [Streptomyces sp. S816]